jgi:predicted glycoside hydrolase/deacetylase ChbG (UPF0249 family)
MTTSHARILIVNADDFGQSASINSGIIEAHRHGIVTSASLMVRWSASAEAAALSKDCPDLSVGLHLDLGEWTCWRAEWVPRYEVVALHDVEAVRAEVASQLASFNRLMGCEPTHLDSHQHVHLREPVRSIARAYADELGVPLRRCGSSIGYCGDFYGQDADGSPLPDRITVEALLRILARLPEGTTELCCHPAAGADLETMYRMERLQELAALSDRRVRDAIASLGITLRSFRVVAA